MNLKIIPGDYSVCKLPSNSTIPMWALESPFFTVSKTDDELSIACESRYIKDQPEAENNFSLIKVIGPLDFNLTGILTSLCTPLSEAKISVFVVSTFDTDYLLIKQEKIEQAQNVLIESGFSFIQ